MEKMVNIGREVSKQLSLININNYEELKAIGSKVAWIKIQQIDSSACINLLYSLEGAIRNIKWFDLPLEIKKELKDFYDKHKL